MEEKCLNRKSRRSAVVASGASRRCTARWKEWHPPSPGTWEGKARSLLYEEVCSGRSGHVEVVQVTFDPAVISFREILEIFFVIHDSTTLNRQGNDIGTQYRSVIFYIRRNRRRRRNPSLNGPMVTAVEPAQAFWEAEAYHQNYLANNPHQSYCAYVVEPKVQKFRKTFAARRKAS